MKESTEKKTAEIIIPKGQTPEEYLDTDNPLEGETPDSIEEVNLRYE